MVDRVAERQWQDFPAPNARRVVCPHCGDELFRPCADRDRCGNWWRRQKEAKLAKK